MQTAFTGHMRPTFEAMLAALVETLPGVPRQALYWRLQFVIGAMARVQHLARQRGAAPPRPGRAIRLAALAPELTAFIEGGIQSIPGASPARRATEPMRSAS